jgi:hypothetical protein
MVDHLIYRESYVCILSAEEHSSVYNVIVTWFCGTLVLSHHHHLHHQQLYLPSSSYLEKEYVEPF